MAVMLNQISDLATAKRPPKRVGRGVASGRGKTCGRGHKGQKARSGVALGGFEGGQMPINRRLPKRGFTNVFRRHYALVNLGGVQQAIDGKKLDPSQPIDGKALIASGLVSRTGDGIRLLADGEIKSKVTIHVAGASAKAKEMVEAKGGTVVVATSSKPKPKSKAKAKPDAKPEAKAKPEAETEAAGDGKDATRKPDADKAGGDK